MCVYAKLKYSTNKRITIYSSLLITVACVADIPIWPTFCQEQIATTIFVSFAYMVILPILCCNTYASSTLMFLVLFTNLAVRRHFNSETGLHYSDVGFLFLGCAAINLILMVDIAEGSFDKAATVNIENEKN